MQVGAAHAAGADLNEGGILGDLRPWHGTDDRLGAAAGESSDADGAVAHEFRLVMRGARVPNRSARDSIHPRIHRETALLEEIAPGPSAIRRTSLLPLTPS